MLRLHAARSSLLGLRATLLSWYVLPGFFQLGVAHYIITGITQVCISTMIIAGAGVLALCRRFQQVLARLCRVG